MATAQNRAAKWMGGGCILLGLFLLGPFTLALLAMGPVTFIQFFSSMLTTPNITGVSRAIFMAALGLINLILGIGLTIREIRRARGA
ncbi:MAG: hypothetical protein PW843_15335 [Azospirillaceae bacterium]|nr:hypothetical protein [Azospirillaceae bacterium]